MTKQEHENRCKELLKRVPADKLRLNGLNHLDSEYIQSLEQRNEELKKVIAKVSNVPEKGSNIWAFHQYSQGKTVSCPLHNISEIIMADQTWFVFAAPKDGWIVTPPQGVEDEMHNC
jgi:hypothetical protein